MSFWKEKRGLLLLWSTVYWILLFCLILGSMLDEKGYVDLSQKVIFILPFVIAPICAMFTTLFYRKNDKEGDKKRFQDFDVALMGKKECLITAIVLFLSWLITLLGVYPGFFNYDAFDEILEVITRNFTTHHPLLHVLYVGGTIQAGYKIFGTYNTGIFLFTLLQMSLFAIGITYAFWKMRKLGVSRCITRIATGVFALFPIFPMYVCCSTKDSIFALFLLLWLVNMLELIWGKGRWQKDQFVDTSENSQPGLFSLLKKSLRENKSLISVILWGALACLTRNNGMYALVVWGIISIFLYKGKRVQLATGLIATVAITCFLTSALTAIFHASDEEHQEMLTVPIQQLTRAYNYNQEIFGKEDQELLQKFLPEEYLSQYRPKVSDLVKVGFDNSFYEKHKGEFWKLWLKIGKKSPMTYVNAWLMTSYGYWYPWADNDVYRGNQVFTFTYEDSSYFAYETEQPGFRDSKIPVIDHFYKNLSLTNWQKNHPVIALFFSPGFMVWLWIFGVIFIMSKKGIAAGGIYLFPMLIVATLLLGPTYLPRYVFFLWLCAPILLQQSSNRYLIERN